MDKKKKAKMVQHEGYYDYMLRRYREEDSKILNNENTAAIMRREIIEMQKTIHVLQMRVKELVEDNLKMKEENANLHNN